jgi:serine/threonine-protein kinase
MVTDFGIGKALSSSGSSTGRTSLTMSSTVMGTPEYMSPEHAAADPATDHRTDIYSFGCVAYELLTGQPPFADVPAHKRLDAQRFKSPAPLSDFRPDVPRPLERLIRRCLESSPDSRPQRAEELTATIESVVSRRTAQFALPTTLLLPLVLGKVLMLYLAGALVVLLLVRGAIAWLGLPGWVQTGAMMFMTLALPVTLWRAWSHYRDRRAASEAPVTRVSS